MVKVVRLLIIMSLVYACSTKLKKNLDPENTDLVDQFDIKSPEFQKFKIEKKDPEVIKKQVDFPVQEIKSKKIYKKKIKKETSILGSIKKFFTANPEKKEVVKVVVEKEIPIIKDPIPEGYPATYLEQDKKSKQYWDLFSPLVFPGEEMHMNIRYLGITAGQIVLKVKDSVVVDGREAYNLYGKMTSAKFYKYIYSIEDTIEIFIDKEDFLPIKYTMFQRESGQKVDDLQLFDKQKRKTFFWYKRLKKGKIKDVYKEAFIPRYIQDSFSSLYFVRGLPLKVGDRYEFPIITRTKLWNLKVHVEKEEVIIVNGKKVSALRLNAETHFPGVLKKKGDIIFWYSNDKYRKLLKFLAKVKIGSVSGELLRYVEGKKPGSY